MHFGTVLLIGIAVNLDNLLIGLSCGMAKKHIPWYHNLIITLVSAVFGGLPCAIAHLIPEKLSVISALLGSFILLGVGAFTIIESYKKRNVTPECPLCCVSLRQLCLISVALALNCLAVSLGMGMSDVPFLFLATSIGIFSFIGINIGNYLGNHVTHIIRADWLDLLSGLLFIAVAVLELLI